MRYKYLISFLASLGSSLEATAPSLPHATTPFQSEALTRLQSTLNELAPSVRGTVTTNIVNRLNEASPPTRGALETVMAGFNAPELTGMYDYRIPSPQQAAADRAEMGPASSPSLGSQFSSMNQYSGFEGATIGGLNT